MKNLTVVSIIALASVVALQVIQAQTTNLSNLSQPSAGNLAVGSDSWLATAFQTGTNGYYLLDSIQLKMDDASGNPGGFSVSIYTNIGASGVLPKGILATLDGSLDPASANFYTFTAVSNLLLSPRTPYFIVLTADTAVANGSYAWDYANTASYNQTSGWFSWEAVWSSSNGSSWSLPNTSYLQFAITATPIPEPGVLSLVGLGGLAFIWHRRKANMIERKASKSDPLRGRVRFTR
jgi:PEP-CTERM motif